MTLLKEMILMMFNVLISLSFVRFLKLVKSFIEDAHKLYY